jgi:hypothetical protein
LATKVVIAYLDLVPKCDVNQVFFETVLINVKKIVSLWERRGQTFARIKFTGDVIQILWCEETTINHRPGTINFEDKGSGGTGRSRGFFVHTALVGCCDISNELTSQ